MQQVLLEYYSHEWLSEDRVSPHQDVEHTYERKKCFKRYFDGVDVRRQANLELQIFLVEEKTFMMLTL